jgi:hypothetical protein
MILLLKCIYDCSDYCYVSYDFICFKACFRLCDIQDSSWYSKLAYIPYMYFYLDTVWLTSYVNLSLKKKSYVNLIILLSINKIKKKDEKTK